MPWRIQNLVNAVGQNKQSNISTVGGTFLRFTKLNARIETNQYGTETNKDEIGKGNEFTTQVFPTAWDVSGSLEKYGSAEFVTWAWAYALGNVAYASGAYTLTPIDPTVTLELPYFSFVQQGNEGGSAAVDEVYIGCAIEDVSTVFTYGPGRQSVKTTVNFHGSGVMTSPSGITVPAVQTEHNMLSQSMAVTINGTDYVAGKTILGGTMAWKNNLLLAPGYFPGSGVTTNGFSGGAAAVRGRMEIGNRVPTFTFRARMLHNSPEYAALIAQTTGTAVITLTYDGTHTTTWTWEQIAYQALVRGEDNGIVTVDVTVAPQFSNSTGILSISSQCGIVGIAQ